MPSPTTSELRPTFAQPSRRFTMCLCLPNFPFRNTIVIDKNSDQEQLMAHPCLVPAEYKKTKRLFGNAAHFLHRNYIHFRNTENLAREELPAPPTCPLRREES